MHRLLRAGFFLAGIGALSCAFVSTCFLLDFVQRDISALEGIGALVVWAAFVIWMCGWVEWAQDGLS